ncbi:MAG: voltage-gated chloride channel family protein [Anaerolineae bacterium]|nr:voltage-gated chloride channel family protein [Anaerolineae bacterium]
MGWAQSWHEQRAFFQTILRWSLLGSAVGLLAGTASAIFLAALDWATATRVAHPPIIFLLPLAGLALGWVYHRYAGTAARGNNLIIEQLHLNRDPLPRRMAPFILLGTVWTHLFGGSAGREGAAVQMGGSLADALRRLLNLQGEDRRWMILAGISGGFGSVFGTPLAGVVFALEVQNTGRVRYEGLIPCLAAALVGDLTTRAWGIAHTHYPHLADPGLQPTLLLLVALAGIIFGLTSLLFIELTHRIKHLAARRLASPPLRPLVGGLIVLVLALLLGTQDYLGLSLPLIRQSVEQGDVFPLAFLLKLIFTAITLGTGFMGGEVTPLFVIGSTLGYTLGTLLGLDPHWLAMLGFVAVFAGASNTPLACTLMGIELFGGGAAIYIGLACFIAYVASGHRSIYLTQRIGTPKTAGVDARPDETLEDLARRWSDH